MDLDELLWAIIEMLDNNNNPWVKDTLLHGQFSANHLQAP
jgi:hypothetical protein